MKLLALCFLLLALFGLIAATPAGRITVRTSSRRHVSVRGNINYNWKGDCHNCDIRTTKDGAQVTSTRSRQWTRKF